jgi:two-component system, sensor histidine kinase
MKNPFAMPGAYSTRAKVEAVTRLVEIVKTTTIPVMLLPLPFVFTVWGDAPKSWLLTWLGVAIAVQVVSLVITHRYSARMRRFGAPDLAQASRWGFHIALVFGAQGIVWGSATLLILVVDSTSHQILLLVMALAYPFATLFGTSFWPSVQYFLMLPMGGLAILALILKGDNGSLGLAAIFFVALLIVHSMARQAYTSTMSGIQLQFDKDELVEQLRAQTNIAEQASAAKSKFLAAASHDLRQPLHALGLFTAALRERVTGIETKPLMGSIEQSVSALSGLLDALLDLSRLDAGIVQAHVRHVDLAPLLRTLSVEYEPQALAKRLNWYCRGSDVVAQTDPVLLETVLRNLLGNALRYTQNGSVGIECTREGDTVRIEVADTGAGIAPEHHREIFREFFQLHNPERDRTKGLGLGLAIVERLSLILGHRIELRSAPGQGTAFTLFLTAGDPDQAAAQIEPETGIEAERPGSTTVLVIEDEAAVRNAMIALLQNWGYQVLGAASLDEAIAMLEQAPDAIVADYRLGNDQTGIVAIEDIRRRYGRAIPALIVTGDTAVRQLGEMAGADAAFLHKPVAPAKLRAFLRSAVAGA